MHFVDILQWPGKCIWQDRGTKIKKARWTTLKLTTTVDICNLWCARNLNEPWNHIYSSSKSKSACCHWNHHKPLTNNLVNQHHYMKNTLPHPSRPECLFTLLLSWWPSLQCVGHRRQQKTASMSYFHTSFCFQNYLSHNETGKSSCGIAKINVLIF